MVGILTAGKAARREHTPCIRQYLIVEQRNPGGKRAAIKCKVILSRALSLEGSRLKRQESIAYDIFGIDFQSR